MTLLLGGPCGNQRKKEARTTQPGPSPYMLSFECQSVPGNARLAAFICIVDFTEGAISTDGSRSFLCDRQQKQKSPEQLTRTPGLCRVLMLVSKSVAPENRPGKSPFGVSRADR